MISVSIDEGLEKTLREEAAKRFGTGKDSLRRAVEEAIRLWLGPGKAPVEPAKQMVERMLGIREGEEKGRAFLLPPELYPPAGKSTAGPPKPPKGENPKG